MSSALSSDASARPWVVGCACVAAGGAAGAVVGTWALIQGLGDPGVDLEGHGLALILALVGRCAVLGGMIGALGYPLVSALASGRVRPLLLGAGVAAAPALWTSWWLTAGPWIREHPLAWPLRLVCACALVTAGGIAVAFAYRLCAASRSDQKLPALCGAIGLCVLGCGLHLLDGWTLLIGYPRLREILLILELVTLATGIAVAWQMVRARGSVPFAVLLVAVFVLTISLPPPGSVRFVVVERTQNGQRVQRLWSALFQWGQESSPAEPDGELVQARQDEHEQGQRSRMRLDEHLGKRDHWNVLWITVDALRFDRLSCYGYPRRTSPELDRLAARGTRFVNAYTQFPITHFAFQSMFHGRYPTATPLYRDEKGISERVEGRRTLAAVAREQGLRTATLPAIPPAGLDEDAYRVMKTGFAEVNPFREGAFRGDSEDQTACALRFLDDARDERFFLWLHYMDPHHPYRLRAEAGFGTSRGDRYDSEIFATDQGIGRVLKRLEDLGIADRTVVVVNADHGEAFGEHGTRFHGSTLYEEQIRVPLVVHVPGVKARTVNTVVENVDLMPTILDLIGIPIDLDLQGRSLVPLILGGDDDPDAPLAFAFAELGLLRTGLSASAARREALRMGDWKLIWNPVDEVAELYDLASDPEEKRNLASERPQEVVKMKSALAGLREECAAVNRGPESGDSEPPVRADPVARALHTLEGSAPWGPVVGALEDLLDCPPEVAAGVRSQIVPLLQAPEVVARRAAWVLARTGDAAGRAVLEAAVSSKDPMVALHGACGLACLGDDRGLAHIREWVPALAFRAANCGRMVDALARLGATQAAPEILALLENRFLAYTILEPIVRWAEACGEEGISAWVSLLASWDPTITAAARQACDRLLGEDHRLRMEAVSEQVLAIADLEEQGSLDAAIAAATEVAQACGTQRAGAGWWLRAARLAHQKGDVALRGSLAARVSQTTVASWREAARLLSQMPTAPLAEGDLELLSVRPFGIVPPNPSLWTAFTARVVNRSENPVPGGIWRLAPQFIPVWMGGGRDVWRDPSEGIRLGVDGIPPGMEATVHLFGRVPPGGGDLNVRPQVAWVRGARRELVEGRTRSFPLSLPAPGTQGLDPTDLLFDARDVRDLWLREPTLRGGEIGAYGAVVFAALTPKAWLVSPVLKDLGRPLEVTLTCRVLRRDATLLAPTLTCAWGHDPVPRSHGGQLLRTLVEGDGSRQVLPAVIPAVGGKGARLIRIEPSDGADLFGIESIRIRVQK